MRRHVLHPVLAALALLYLAAMVVSGAMPVQRQLVRFEAKGVLKLPPDRQESLAARTLNLSRDTVVRLLRVKLHLVLVVHLRHKVASQGRWTPGPDRTVRLHDDLKRGGAAI